MTAARRPTLVAVYGVFAAVGAVVPYAILIPWMREHGWAPAAFFAGPFANPPAALFSADVLLSATVFLIFAVTEARRLGMKRPWLAPLVTVAIGLCCALPLFLLQRELARSR